jgi:hypothetical protein
LLKDYNFEVQKLFLRMMVTNAELFTRVANIVNSDNFDKTLKPVVEFLIEHTNKYSVMPDTTQIQVTTGVEIELVTELSDGHYEWFFDEFEAFTRRQELERAILKAADLLEKGEYDPVEIN